MWRAFLARLCEFVYRVETEQCGLRKLHMVGPSTTQIVAAFLKGMLKDPRCAPVAFTL